MKAILTCLALSTASLLAQSPSPASARELKQLLQDGLFEEEANRNLEKAAAAYEALLAGYEQQRQFAATALFRLAEVRAKQNRKDDAIALYQRVAAEFGKDPLAKLSRERLASLGSTAPAEGAPVVADKEAEEIARLQDLVKNSPDLLNAADQGITPLGRAAREGWLNAARFLLDNDADLGGRFGSPALHLAALNGRKAMVELLLDRGADVNGKDQIGDTPLVAAVTSSRPEVAKVLLDRGANPDARNHTNHTPLHYTCGKGDVEMLRLLLTKAKDLNAISDHKPDFNDSPAGTPLMFAIRSHKLDLAKLLVERGADVNFETPSGESAIRAAVKSGYRPMLEYLLDHKANARAAGLLPFAIRWNRGEFLPLLIKHGADVNAADPDLGPPLHYAITDSTELTQALFEAGANPNGTDSFGRTALHKALGLFNAQAVPRPMPTTFSRPGSASRPRFIAPPNASSKVKEPADALAIFKLLVEKGADVNARDKNGITVLMEAVLIEAVPQEVLELLLARGADPSLKTDDGGTAFAMAHTIDRRVWLEQQSLFPQWVKEGNIAVVNRLSGYLTEQPFKISPVAEFDYPPTAAEALRQMLTSIGGGAPNLPADFEVAVFRPGRSGKFERIALTSVSFSGTPKFKTPIPQLQWKDVVVAMRDQSGGGLVSSASFRSLGMEPSGGTKVTIELGERKTELKMNGAFQHWSPITSTVPAWNLAELIGQATAAEPRADLSAVKLRRSAEGAPKEWTIDLRSIIPGQAMKSIPARLADGDVVSVPLLSADDSNALTQRRSGIYRAAPGRLFGERVFHLAPLDDAPRTLGDLLVVTYATSPMIIPNPDLSRIKIHRLKGDKGEEETLEIDFASKIDKVTGRTSAEDARKLDVSLQAGDVVEIAVAPDLPTEEWTVLSGQARLFLGKAVARNVTVFGPNLAEETKTLSPVFTEARLNRAGIPQWERQPIPPFFRAMNVIKSPKQLLKVTISSRGKSTQYTPESIQSINPWLVDGDVIEVERF